MKVVFFPHVPNLGHLVPGLMVAEQLRERGADIAFRGEGRYAALVSRASFALRPAFTFSEDHGRRHEMMLGHWTAEVVQRSIASELAAFEEDEPDVVVGDFRPTLGISSRVRGVPFVSINGAELTRDFAYPETLPRIPGTPARIMAGARPDAVPSLIRTFFHAAGRHLRGAARQYGVSLPGEGSLLDAWMGDVNLLPDVPELMPLRPGAPSNLEFIGPALRPMPNARGDLLDGVDPTRPLVYVSFGSTGGLRQEDPVAMIADAFADGEVQVVMTTADLFDVPLSLPAHVRVTDFADGLNLARRASVTVCAGGKGTVYQSLSQGTPVVCLPRNHDQWYVSYRVARSGAGMLCDMPLAGRSLRAVVDAAIANRELRRRAEVLGERIRQLTAERRAAPLIEAVAARVGKTKSLARPLMPRRPTGRLG